MKWSAHPRSFVAPPCKRFIALTILLDQVASPKGASSRRSISGSQQAEWRLLPPPPGALECGASQLTVEDQMRGVNFITSAAAMALAFLAGLGSPARAQVTAFEGARLIAGDGGVSSGAV